MAEQNVQAWEQAARRRMSLDPTVAKLEQAYPRVSDAAIEAGRPLARSYCEQLVGRMVEVRAQTYAQQLSPRELAEAIAFFESPAGRSLVRHALASSTVDPVLDQMAHQAAEAGRTSFTEERAQQIGHASADRMARETPVDDQLAGWRFQLTETGKKYGQARHASDPIILQMVNAPDQHVLQKMNDVMSAAILAYVDRKKAH